MVLVASMKDECDLQNYSGQITEICQWTGKKIYS